MNRRENLIRTIARDHPQWIPYRYDGCLTTLIPPVTALTRGGGLDDWGVVWRESAEGSYPKERGLVILDEVQLFRPPDTDWEQVTDLLQQEVQRHREEDALLVASNDLVLLRPGASAAGHQRAPDGRGSTARPVGPLVRFGGRVSATPEPRHCPRGRGPDTLR